MKITNINPISPSEREIYEAELREHNKKKEEWRDWYAVHSCDMKCSPCKHIDVCTIRTLYDL